MKSLFTKLAVSMLLVTGIAGRVHATRVYVSSSVSASGGGTSWIDAYKTLQEAVDAANTSSAITEIWVQAGTYYPAAYPVGSTGSTSDRDYAFTLRNNLAIYGGFAGTETAVSQRTPGNVTVLSGDIGTAGVNTDNCYHVLFSVNNDSTAVLDGVTVTGGNANGPSTGITFGSVTCYRNGCGGIFLVGSSAIISNCSLTANSTSGAGGALFGSSSSPTLSNCRIFSNTAANAGAGIYCVRSPVTLTSCSIYNNTAGYFGGGLYCLTLSPSTLTNCSIYGNAGTYGGGMFCNGSSPSVMTNCSVYGNTSTIAGGGGLLFASSPATLTGCSIYQNTANGSAGGLDIYDNTTVNASNCSFMGNIATRANGTVGTGGAVQLESATAVGNFTNCVFSGNRANGTADDGGGALCLYGGTARLTNCTLWDNTTTSTALPGANALATPGSGTSINIINSILWGAGAQFATGANITATYSDIRCGPAGTGNVLNAPQFLNSAAPAGADGILGNLDDGLVLQACSPAINAGTTPSTAVPADVLGNSRVGAYDMGAYEYQGTPASTIAAASAAESNNQACYTSYGSCGNLIAQVQSAGASSVTGNTTAKVFVRGTAALYRSQPYVRRSYDIRPTANPDAATAIITLYFTQADFSDYNNIRGSYPSLPLNTADTEGYRMNLRMTQQHGSSTDPDGAPGTYTGWPAANGPANGLITPTTVAYNNVLSRWEVTFPVTGFSGFFAHTTNDNTPLPVKLLSFAATRAGEGRNRLDWATATEDAGTAFEVARSSNGTAFVKLGTVAGKGGSSSYAFYDNQPLEPISYYRLQITEASGGVSYSNVAIVRSTAGSGVVTVAPVPANRSLRITHTDASLQGAEAAVLDMQGRTVHRFVLDAVNTLDISSWPAGIYSLRLAGGRVVRIVKQ